LQDSEAFAIGASKSTDHDSGHLRRLIASQCKLLDTGLADSKDYTVKIRYCVLGARKAGSEQYASHLC
jgi:hypothetical protein